jgi:hypothetical protein
MTIDPPPSPLFSALAKAQGEMTGATKDRANPHFKSTYATLASVVDAVRLPLSRNGIAYTQQCAVDGRTVRVETVLLHGSGERLGCGLMSAEAKDGGPQAIGSTLTYLRRYSLMAAVGIAPEDDDGESGEQRQAQAAPAPAPQLPQQTRTVDDLVAAISKLGLEPSAVDGWLASLGKPTVGVRAARGDVAGLQGVLTALQKQGRSGFDQWVIQTQGSGE